VYIIYIFYRKSQYNFSNKKKNGMGLPFRSLLAVTLSHFDEMGTTHNILRMRILAREHKHQNENHNNGDTHQTRYAHPLQGFDNPHLPQSPKDYSNED
jgi:hypothetical protein